MTDEQIEDFRKALLRLVEDAKNGDLKVDAIRMASRGRNPLIHVTTSGAAPVTERLKIADLVHQLNSVDFKVTSVRTEMTIIGQVVGKGLHFEIRSDERS